MWPYRWPVQLNSAGCVASAINAHQPLRGAALVMAHLSSGWLQWHLCWRGCLSLSVGWPLVKWLKRVSLSAAAALK